MAGNSAESGRSVASKISSILLTFTDGNRQSLTEIARLAGLPVSTAHRLVTELSAWGVLERTGEAQYQVGVPVRVMGSRLGHASSLDERARRVVEDVAAATHCAVRLGVLEEDGVAYIEKQATHRPLSNPSASAVLPAHACAMGKALLAFSPPHLVERIAASGLQRFTPHTITSVDRLRRHLSVVRLTHVAVCRGELDPECSAVAVPVFAGGGAVVAALEAGVRDLGGERRVLQPVLTLAARSLSRELALTPPTGRLVLGHDCRAASALATAAGGW